MKPELLGSCSAAEVGAPVRAVLPQSERRQVACLGLLGRGVAAGLGAGPALAVVRASSP